MDSVWMPLKPETLGMKFFKMFHVFQSQPFLTWTLSIRSSILSPLQPVSSSVAEGSSSDAASSRVIGTKSRTWEAIGKLRRKKMPFFFDTVPHLVNGILSSR
ncbi:hypothetical protein EPI10_026723 [Gossypium australe]|uniref:Uncharacterized protein n=1 Tax=Gossypium australe TaxID=47621 RepID=A0A5B6UU95_9ROSI|nr:hypothetical protein EPI10_026723 [Gossypium australe]